MPVTVRRQQSRSLETREKLVQAALDAIYDLGYHAATTQEFAERAQVSRGALLHHFPTRADIITAAMENLLETQIDEIRSMVGDVASGRTTVQEFVDFLWGIFSGRFFYLSLELITESRNDGELRERMIPVVKQFLDTLDTTWAQFGEAKSRPAKQARIALNLTLCLLRGMGIQTVLKPDRRYYEELITAWKLLLPYVIDSQIDDNAQEIQFAPNMLDIKGN